MDIAPTRNDLTTSIPSAAESKTEEKASVNTHNAQTSSGEAYGATPFWGGSHSRPQVSPSAPQVGPSAPSNTTSLTCG